MLKSSLTNESDKIFMEQTRNVKWDIAECLRGSRNLDVEYYVLPAYLLSVISTLNEPMAVQFQDLIDGEIVTEPLVTSEIKRALDEAAWESLKGLLSKYKTEDFAATALEVDRELTESTPETITALVTAIFDIKQNDVVADVGCGSGAFIMDAASTHPDAEYVGFEIHSANCANANIRSQLIKSRMSVYNRDAFTLASDRKSSLIPEAGFDYVFSNFPFGVRVRSFAETMGMRTLMKEYPELQKSSTADWLFNVLLLSITKQDGKAIGISTNGSSWNQTDIGIRKHLVEKGLIEAVISLPERLFKYAGIATTLYIMSRGNKSIRFVDASKIVQKGRRSNYFSQEDIERIVEALHRDTDYSQVFDIESIQKRDYILNPNHYLAKDIEYENGVTFGDIIEDVTRGAPLSASQLDDLISTAPTESQYLMLASIKDGMIDEELPYLSSLDSRYERYRIQPGNLILAKNGPPFKMAVVNDNIGNGTIANGNLYVISLKQEMANPYYIQAYLESAKGSAQLNQNAIGTALRAISLNGLKSILIPLPPLEEQNRIANLYLASQDEVRILRRKMENAQNRLLHLYDNESEGQ